MPQVGSDKMASDLKQASIGPDKRSAASAQTAAPEVRLRPIQRNQLCWHMLDVDRLIDEDHPARAIWEFVGRLDLTSFLEVIESFESCAGRPAFDPQLLISLWVYAYSRGVGSAREISRRCEYEPAFQWLTGLDSVNYHTLSDFRITHLRALDELFTQVLGVLDAEGLISLERVTHDGTKIAANAAQRSFCAEDRIRDALGRAREQVEALRADALVEPTPNLRSQKAVERARRERVGRLELALTEFERIKGAKRPGYKKASKQQTGTSITDPQARIMKQGAGQHYGLSYNVQLSTDAYASIVVSAAVSQTAPDYEHLVPAVEQVAQRLGARPKQVIVDAGYSSRQNIVELHAQSVDMIGNWVESDGRVKHRFARVGVTAPFLPAMFEYHEASDMYRCPEGKQLRRDQDIHRPGRVMRRYRARVSDCRQCPCRPQCCAGNTRRYGRALVVTHEDPIVTAYRAQMTTPEAYRLRRLRGQVAEFTNAWLKEKLGLRRFHVRGLAKVRSETLWAVLTYNLQQWIRLRWRPRWTCA
jgi:transposase